MCIVNCNLFLYLCYIYIYIFCMHVFTNLLCILPRTPKLKVSLDSVQQLNHEKMSICCHWRNIITVWFIILINILHTFVYFYCIYIPCLIVWSLWARLSIIIIFHRFCKASIYHSTIHKWCVKTNCNKGYI